jgi:hypothetical protein
MSKLLSSIAGGGGLPRLAPDLTFPSSRVAGGANFKRITFNPVGALTTALSLTGKWSVSALVFSGFTAETVTVKLTVDGVIVWNDTHTAQTFNDNVFLGSVGGLASSYADTVTSCNSTFLLEVQTLTDTAVTLDYLARPIL